MTNQSRREYSTCLQERNQTTSKEVIWVEDIVLLKNDSTCRSYWKLTKVEQIVCGSDGRTRAAIIRVSSDSKPPVDPRRVIQHLILLEVRVTTLVEQQYLENDEPTTSMRVNTKFRRKAAIDGEINRWNKNLVWVSLIKFSYVVNKLSGV